MRYPNKITFMVILLLSVHCALMAQKGSLRGTVKTGIEPLSSAVVSIADQKVITDENGQFRISLEVGNYLVVITHAGYKTLESTIHIAHAEPTDLEFPMVPYDLLEEVTVMGAKTGTGRSSLTTSVPTDVISSTRLSQTNHPSLLQMLFYSLPSLNSDRQKMYEPVTYRGMDPHHLLILLNNVRYHNSAALNNGVPKSDLGRGSTSNDLGTIPFAAIEKVEILRDGASAQYGSDAIAAVLNVRLKESTGKAFIHANTGQFYAGDGFKSWVGFYKGFRLKNRQISSADGFIGFSGEMRTQAPTTRTGIYPDLVYESYRSGMSAADSALTKARDDSIVKANGIDRKMFTRHMSTARLHSVGLLMNGYYQVRSQLKINWTATINYKKNFVWGNYRFPNDTLRVNTLLHPHGIKPLPTSANLDVTLILGFKGTFGNEWQWEFSSSFGNNINRSEVEHTNNPSQQISLGANAPTSFHLGTLRYDLFVNNISVIKDLKKKSGSWKSNKLIFGTEWRIERYGQKAGDEAAYTDYDGTGVNKIGSAIPSIGSVSRKDVVNVHRSASSAFVYWEMEPHERLLVDAATRYEYYSDFGSNMAGKLAMRYRFSSKFSLRGSISNGFRAPSLQQRYWSGIQQFRGRTEIIRIFNNESSITKAFHIPSLTAEKATNLSLGFTARINPHIRFTLDGYLVQVKNRIVLSGVFRRTDPQVNAILADHPGIDLVQFYTNAINTRTYGADAVFSGNWSIRKTHLNITLAGNINRHSIFGAVKTTDVVTNISNYTNTLFGIEERTTLKKDQPAEKIILSAFLDKGKYQITLRNTYFGSTGLATIITTPAIDTQFLNFSPRILTDCSISFQAKPWLTFTLGANNIFNKFPDRIQNPVDRVSLYSNGAIPYGTNGGYYFMNLNLAW